MSTLSRVRDLVQPILNDLSIDLYDLELNSGLLRVVIDKSGGVDMESIALVTRLVSRELDHQDPIPGRYTLEVSSPGLERTLRTPEHFRRAVGSAVTVRLRPIVDGDRRFDGRLAEADETTIAIDTNVGRVSVAIDDIDRAKTVFVWGPEPKAATKKSGQKPATTKKPVAHPKQAAGQPAGSKAAASKHEARDVPGMEKEAS